MERSGAMTVLRTTPTQWSNPDFSPDGSLIAMDVLDNGHTDIWVRAAVS